MKRHLLSAYSREGQGERGGAGAVPGCGEYFDGPFLTKCCRRYCSAALVVKKAVCVPLASEGWT